MTRNRQTISEAQRDLTRAFKAAGIETPALDARILLAAVAGLKPTAMALSGEQVLTTPQADQLATFKAARLTHKPISKILGKRAFWKKEFIVNAHVLDPRADSEALIEQALQRLPDGQPMDILDLGTGSGCLLLSLMAERPMLKGIGADISPDALKVAHDNHLALGIGTRAAFVESDWFSRIEGRFDMIIANPPYISDAEMRTLDEAVAAHDPYLALHGGTDGLDAYRAIMQQIADFLHPSGWLIFEIGAQQSAAVLGLMAAAGLGKTSVHQDLAGRDRVVCGQLL